MLFWHSYLRTIVRNDISNTKNHKSNTTLERIFFLRTAVLEKLVYILVTMNETSILHLASGKVTLQARRAVNQSKKPANEKFVYRDNLHFLIIMRLLRFYMELLILIQNCNAR
jgi:hypothetical protein